MKIEDYADPRSDNANKNDFAKYIILDRVIDGSGPETTGKFGTGFLTTHLLSRIVSISGVFNPY